VNDMPLLRLQLNWRRKWPTQQAHRESKQEGNDW